MGMWTAIIWLAEVGEIVRFATMNRLIAYAGLDLSGGDLGRQGGEYQGTQG